uniref:FA_FANCE domain-containing protein n=1 Tax=Hydatigena taeniaeformis TaxID=6205 RepID=A0A0R3WVA5_HYDTA
LTLLGWWTQKLGTPALSMSHSSVAPTSTPPFMRFLWPPLPPPSPLPLTALPIAPPTSNATVSQVFGCPAKLLLKLPELLHGFVLQHGWTNSQCCRPTACTLLLRRLEPWLSVKSKAALAKSLLAMLQLRGEVPAFLAALVLSEVQEQGEPIFRLLFQLSFWECFCTC